MEKQKMALSTILLTFKPKGTELNSARWIKLLTSKINFPHHPTSLISDDSFEHGNIFFSLWENEEKNWTFSVLRVSLVILLSISLFFKK